MKFKIITTIWNLLWFGWVISFIQLNITMMWITSLLMTIALLVEEIFKLHKKYKNEAP